MAKNTKQSKQKKSVLNKLGGLSKRSKFIVVVLIFAVLGGGYLTYKSFAATTLIDSKAAADTGNLRNGAYVKTETLSNSGKNGTKVVALRGYRSNVEYMGANGVTKPENSYRFCFYARVEGTISFIVLKTTVTKISYNLGYPAYRSDAAEFQKVDYRNPNTYQQYCSGKFAGNKRYLVDEGQREIPKEIHFKIENDTQGTALIGQIYLHKCLDSNCAIGAAAPTPNGK
jgi:hypothetical protein